MKYKISKKELLELLNARAVLDALEAGGVDNWEWYGDSISEHLVDVQEVPKRFMRKKKKVDSKESKAAKASDESTQEIQPGNIEKDCVKDFADGKYQTKDWFEFVEKYGEKFTRRVMENLNCFMEVLTTSRHEIDGHSVEIYLDRIGDGHGAPPENSKTYEFIVSVDEVGYLISFEAGPGYFDYGDFYKMDDAEMERKDKQGALTKAAEFQREVARFEKIEADFLKQVARVVDIRNTVMRGAETCVAFSIAAEGEFIKTTVAHIYGRYAGPLIPAFLLDLTDEQLNDHFSSELAEKIEADKKRERECISAKVAEAKKTLAEYEGLSMEEVGK